MVEIEIDGTKVEVTEGSMVMHAANKLGIFVPHFCYHKKLSIAANCRMCLVEVEKAPKPLPACATPVSNGMKVRTKSPLAVRAQKGVMEFLLINHPLDCPICDQGGECQLQDLAVGYGGSASHYTEEKRVVFHKPLGPLISAQEMTRCIHCTRCVRFGQEIGGMMELGMANRGEHSEIMSFVGRSVDSEISGNMIDICPVGALTSKPFRYAARTWELARRRTIAPHDSLGSNLVAHVKLGEVLRVVPLENEAVNECWISDRDRFSYEGLNTPDRLTQPMVKRDGRWVETDWPAALSEAALALATARVDHGSRSLGALAAPTATVEELYLLQKLIRAMGSDNVDFRLRQSDFDIDTAGQGAPWLGMPVERLSSLDRLFLVGSFLRKDHPLLAARIRVACAQGLQLSVLHAADDDLLMPVAHKVITAPSAWRGRMLEVLAALLEARGAQAPANLGPSLAGVTPGPEARAIATALASSENGAVLLGNAAVQHPQASDLMRIGQAIADVAGLGFGVIGEAANSVGGYLAGATPRAIGAVTARALGSEGLSAAAQLGPGSPLRAFLLLHLEPALDTVSGRAALQALAMADVVVALTPWKSDDLMSVAQVLLPVAPFTETGGSFVNAEGRLQSFNGVARPVGQSRPAWKVLRVLADTLDIKGFGFESVEDVRIEALLGSSDGERRRFVADPAKFEEIAGPGGRFSMFEDNLSNRLGGEPAPAAPDTSPRGLERLTDVPIYWTDALVRRAASLQLTRDAAAPVVRAHPETLAALGVADGEPLVCVQDTAEVTLSARADAGIAVGVLRVPAAHPDTANLRSFFGPIEARRA